MAEPQYQRAYSFARPSRITNRKERKERKDHPIRPPFFVIHAFFAVKLQVHPVTLGTGTKLFADGTIPAAFSLVECTAPPVE